mgnify:FL=1
MINTWEIVESVSKALNVKEMDIASKSRKTDIVDAKTIIAQKIYEKTSLKLHLIYDVIYHQQTRKADTRHCNIVNLLKRYDALSRFNKKFKIKVELCKDI